MKNILALGFVLVMFLGANSEIQAQCNAELFISKALQQLTPGFTFVKSYRIDGRNGTRPKIEYTCVFSKDTNYTLTIVGKDGGSQGIIATLYDSRRNQMVSNFSENKFYQTLNYKCRATGIYYLTFTFKDPTPFCGGAVLGFKR
jgi:hypothetical protein